jgi:hypothetical protein
MKRIDDFRLSIADSRMEANYSTSAMANHFGGQSKSQTLFHTGRNISKLFPEPGVLASGENVPVAVDFGLFVQEAERPALPGQGGNRFPAQLVPTVFGLNHQNGHARPRGKTRRSTGVSAFHCHRP